MKEMIFLFGCGPFSNAESVNVVMETKGGKKTSSSSSSLQYEVPLGYSIEDVRPNGGIEKFRCAAYSNVTPFRSPLAFALIFKHLLLVLTSMFSLFCFLRSAWGSHPDTVFANAFISRVGFSGVLSLFSSFVFYFSRIKRHKSLA